VVLIGISDDPPDALYSWAKDLNYQGLFGSDAGNKAYQALGGTNRDNGQVSSRAVFVIDKTGKIDYEAPAFNQNDPQAYEDLAKEIDKLSPPADK
jgi:peroxiredoxin